uniref:Gp04 putative replication protein n=1 Tax=uncultured marine virus TaxID=186617 RepID=A0A0F7L4N3_9VIRU|nr:gp04 putative replication protein [uncultured marine virus]
MYITARLGTRSIWHGRPIKSPRSARSLQMVSVRVKCPAVFATGRSSTTTRTGQLSGSSCTRRCLIIRTTTLCQRRLQNTSRWRGWLLLRLMENFPPPRHLRLGSAFQKPRFCNYLPTGLSSWSMMLATC